MRKTYLLLLIIGFFIIATVFIVWYSNNSVSMEKATICFENKNCFNLEVARTDLEKVKGLMFIEQLDANKGMLFVYDEEGDRGFWMKNMVIPLDIIGLDKNFSVVFIENQVLPCEENRCEILNIKNSMYVLEINSGIVNKINLSIGDKAEIKF